MTPLQIEILFHYRCSPYDYRDGDLSAPAVRDAINGFLDSEVLVHEGFSLGYHENGKLAARYRLTSRGRAFVDYLQMIPLPTASWTFGQVSWVGQRD